MHSTDTQHYKDKSLQNIMSTITFDDLPQWLQIMVAALVVLVVLVLCCVASRIKWLLQTLWCILCCPTRCCRVSRPPQYQEL